MNIYPIEKERYQGFFRAKAQFVYAGLPSWYQQLEPFSNIKTQAATCVIGNGVGVDPAQLITEMEMLADRGLTVTPDRLLISDRAHVVLPYHKEHDAAMEQVLAGAAGQGDEHLSIGTTNRGIGPTYADKVHRSMADTYKHQPMTTSDLV